MRKCKCKKIIINNNVNEIDYDKLAEAIVKAKQIEEENIAKKKEEERVAWRKSIGFNNHEEKKGLKRKIYFACSRIKVFFNILFFSKKKKLKASMTGAFMQGITTAFFNLIKWFLWFLSAAFILSIFSHGEVEFTILDYITCVGRAMLAVVLAAIFRLMAIETEQLTDRERILGIFMAVVAIIPMVEGIMSIVKEVGSWLGWVTM